MIAAIGLLVGVIAGLVLEPTVPLWLGTDFAAPLDLEASHSAACVDLRIRQVG